MENVELEIMEAGAAEPVTARPSAPPPLAKAPLSEREAWARVFVTWFLYKTGGDPEIYGVPTGHRWRTEYFDCVQDPRAFEERAEKEVIAYEGGE